MNMFYEFFKSYANVKTVEVDGGRFELKKTLETDPCKALYFIKQGIAQPTLVNDRVMRIAPFGGTGVACQPLRALGDRRIHLYFFEQDKLLPSKGYIIDPEHLIYMYQDQMLMASYCSYNVDPLFSKATLEGWGYQGEIYLDQELFYIPSGQTELVPFHYFNYSGEPLNVYKETKIACEIMLQLRMFITKEFSKKCLGSDYSHKISALTWEAKSATIADVDALLALERAEENLFPPNAKKILSVMEDFSASEDPRLFTRYMEFIFTANKDICKNIDFISQKIIGRSDLRELLSDYQKFELILKEILSK